MDDEEKWCIVTRPNDGTKEIREIEGLFYRSACNLIQKCTTQWAKKELTVPAIRKRHARILENGSHVPIGYITGVFVSKEKANEHLNDKSQGRGKRPLKLSTKVPETPQHMPKESSKKSVKVGRKSQTKQSVDDKELQHVKSRVTENKKLKAAIEQSTRNSAIDIKKFLNQQKVTQLTNVSSVSTLQENERNESSMGSQLSQLSSSYGRTCTGEAKVLQHNNKLPAKDATNEKRKQSNAGLMKKEYKKQRTAVESLSSVQLAAKRDVRDEREKHKTPNNMSHGSEELEAFAVQRLDTPKTHIRDRDTGLSAMIRGNVKLKMSSFESCSANSMSDELLVSNGLTSALKMVIDEANVTTAPDVINAETAMLVGTFPGSTDSKKTTPIENSNVSSTLSENGGYSKPPETRAQPLATGGLTQSKGQTLKVSKIVDDDIGSEEVEETQQRADDGYTRRRHELTMTIHDNDVSIRSQDDTFNDDMNSNHRREDESSTIGASDIVEEMPENSGPPYVNGSDRSENQTSKIVDDGSELADDIEALRNTIDGIDNEEERPRDKTPPEEINREDTSDQFDSEEELPRDKMSLRKISQDDTSNGFHSEILPGENTPPDEMDSEEGSNDETPSLFENSSETSIRHMTQSEKIKYFTQKHSGTDRTRRKKKTLSEKKLKEYRQLLANDNKNSDDDEDESYASRVNVLKEALRQTLSSEQKWKRKCRILLKQRYSRNVDNLLNKKMKILCRRLIKNLGNRMRNLENRVKNCCERLAVNIRNNENSDVSDDELAEARRIPEMNYNEPLEKGMYCNVEVFTKPLNAALKAPNMRRRCAKVVEALWTPEERHNLTWKKTKQYPNRRVITKEEETNILTICEKLQLVEGRKLPVNDGNNVKNQLRKWVSVFLKHDRINYKRQHEESLIDQSSVADQEPGLSSSDRESN